MTDSRVDSPNPWAFMAPWCAALQGRLRLRSGVQYMHRTPANDKRWELHVSMAGGPKPEDLPAQDPASGSDRDATAIRELKEALELLCLLAAVDNDAWRRLLAECITVDLHEGDQLVPDRFFPLPPLRFRLDERDAEFAELASLLQCFFMTAERHPTSGEFRAARRHIMAMTFGDRHEASFESLQGLQVPFNVELFPMRSDDSEALATALGSVFQTLDAVESRPLPGYSTVDKANRGFWTKYVVQSRTLFTGAVPIGPRLARALFGCNQDNGNRASDYAKQLPQTCNLTGWSVSLNADVQLPMALAGRLFRHIATGGGVHRSAEEESSRLLPANERTLSVMLDSTSSWKFRCAMSALVGARGIGMVTLDGMFEAPEMSSAAQRLKWQWLAFALFSKASEGSSITKVVLDDLRISPSDVDAIAAVLQSSQPEPRVIATAGDASLQAAVGLRDYVRVHPSANLCMQAPPAMDESGDAQQQQPNDQRSTPFSLDPGQATCWFQVLEDPEVSAHSVSILVPGYGKCLAPRSSIVETDRRLDATSSTPTDKSSGELLPGGSVRSMSLSFDHDIDSTVLPRLLQLVGRSLEYLSIANVGCRRWHHHRDDTDDGVDLSWLAVACPNLRHLRLADSHVQLDSLVGVAAVCKLEILELHRSHVTTKGVRQFAQALGDAGSRLATHLTELSLHCCDESRRGLGQAGVEALEAVLSSNSRLQFFRLWVPRSLSEVYLPRLREFDAQPLAVMRESLPLACKLAFLSCVTSICSSTGDVLDKKQVPALHEDVLRGIFDLAATCETRRVAVTIL